MNLRGLLKTEERQDRVPVVDLPHARIKSTVRTRRHLPSMTPGRKEKEARVVQLSPVPQKQVMAKLSLGGTRNERGAS